MKNLIKNICFIVSFVFIFYTFDGFIQKKATASFLEGYFPLNTYEIARRDNPQEIWDKVFFGNSVVMGGFAIEENTSGHINFGMELATIENLWSILNQNDIKIGDELVIGVSLLAFYDELATNDTYIFHKKTNEPFVYFYRERLNKMFNDKFNTYFDEPDYEPIYSHMTRNASFGTISESGLETQIQKYQDEFWCLDISSFENNLNALEKIVDYCAENEIRVRMIIMPQTDIFKEQEIVGVINEKVLEIAENQGIDVLDTSSVLENEDFYDVVHLSYDTGAKKFTEYIDEWLNN